MYLMSNMLGIHHYVSALGAHEIGMGSIIEKHSVHHLHGHENSIIIVSTLSLKTKVRHHFSPLFFLNV